jgi:hypothetical protein
VSESKAMLRFERKLMYWRLPDVAAEDLPPAIQVSVSGSDDWRTAALTADRSGRPAYAISVAGPDATGNPDQTLVLPLGQSVMIARVNGTEIEGAKGFFYVG